MPAYDVVLCTSNEDRRNPSKPYPVDMDDMMYLTADGGYGSYLPETGDMTPECPSWHVEFYLGSLREQPVKKQFEKLCCLVIFLRG